MIDANPVREEAVVRAHAWCVRMWNERKISAEFTSADEAENADCTLAPETVAALGEVARAVYINHLETDNAELRRQLASAHGKLKDNEIAFGKCAAEIEATHRQLAECQEHRDQLRSAFALAADNPDIPEYIRDAMRDILAHTRR